MTSEERKGSTLTSIIAALVFALILAIFGRSVHGEKSQQPAGPQPSSAVVEFESSVIDSGFYQIHVLDEAKHHFMPVLSDLQ